MITKEKVLGLLIEVGGKKQAERILCNYLKLQQLQQLSHRVRESRCGEGAVLSR